jgi:hypothetical protein
MSNHLRVQWLFWKMLGAIYALAFGSLAVQIGGLIGSRGVLPAATYLGRIAQALGPSRFWRVPTVFWLRSGDLALKVVCWVGVALAILVVAGVFERAALIGCYALYLSLVTVGQDFLSFQWDVLLLETGFLAIFLGSSPVILWLFRWLLFRLMLLSGAVKLLSGDAAWRALSALNFHYWTQPLPTPPSWYMAQLPPWFQQISVVVALGIELVAPFLIFRSRRLRLYAAGAFVLLQTLILLTGNYAFFNWLTLALCVTLLDDDCLRRVPASSAVAKNASIGRYVSGVVAAVIVLISGSQLMGEFFGADLYPAHAMPQFYIANTYGLFAVMTTVRHEIIVEGSDDRSQWRAYEFRYKPGDVNRCPPWVAPHQPRLDWQMWFAALGSYRDNPWFVNFAYRLLEGSTDVLGLLRSNPFPAAPPHYIRALVYDYRFTDWRMRREDGACWQREPVGTYLPEVSLRSFQPAQ